MLSFSRLCWFSRLYDSIDYSYWIIDVNSRKVLGPLNEKDFEEETEQLEITDWISLESIEKLDRY